jgi:cytochrome bd-type quinol oxidase subunit 2
MKFKTEFKYNVYQLLFSILPAIVVVFLRKFNIIMPSLLTYLIVIFGYIFLITIFEFFNSVEGKLSGIERLKIDKTYRNTKIISLMLMVILIIVYIVVWYRDIKTF